MSDFSEQEEFEFRLRLEREREQQPSTEPTVVMPGDEPLDERSQQIQFREGLRETVEGGARQVGLTARAGLEGAITPFALPGDVMGFDSSKAFSNLLTKMGLPVPQEGTTEEFANIVASGMTGAGGIAAAAKVAKPISRATRGVTELLATSPGAQVAAGGVAGAAGAAAQEAGAGPIGQFAAGMGGALAAPGVIGAGHFAGRSIADIVNALRAAFGSQKGVEKITADAVRKLVESDPDAIASALQNTPKDIPGVKSRVGDAIAERNLAIPDEQVGGAVIKLQQALTGAKGIEDILPTVMRQQDEAVKQYLKSLTEATNPMREQALAKARKGGTSSIGPLVDIMNIQGTPGFRGSQVVYRATNSIRRQIERVTDEKGYVDPEDLYSVRKELGNMIKKAIGVTDESGRIRWDKAMEANLESTLKSSIDNAIEMAGGTGWKRYLDFYSKGRAPVSRREKRLELQKEIAGQTKSTSVEDLAEAELPKLPTLLHRPTMAVNFALRLIARDLTEPVTKELAKRMTDPEKFLELMRRPDGTPAKESMKVLLARAGVLANLIIQHQQDVAQQER